MAKINGSVLRELREGQNLTLEALSEKSGVDESTIHRLETGARKGEPGWKPAPGSRSAAGRASRTIGSLFFPLQFELGRRYWFTRTFWEKATILHALHHNEKLREGMSRHYYDTLMLARGGIAGKALTEPDLLEQVVRNKSLMFADKSASYETATLGTLRLIPSATTAITSPKH